MKLMSQCQVNLKGLFSFCDLKGNNEAMLYVNVLQDQRAAIFGSGRGICKSGDRASSGAQRVGSPYL